MINSIEFDPDDRRWLTDALIQCNKKNWSLEQIVNDYKYVRSIGNDASSVRSFIIRYGFDLGVKMFEEKVALTKTPKGRYQNVKREKPPENN